MKFTHPAVLTILALLSSSFAQKDCTQSNAQQYVDPSNDPCSAAAINRDDTGCVKQYCTKGGTSASLNACFCLAGIGENCGGIRSGRDVESVDKRATFQCPNSRTCYKNPADGGLFCLDSTTGDYTGESGDSGNVNTGAYTAAPGGGTATSTTRSAGTSGTTTSTRRSSSSVASSSPSANAGAASTATSGSSQGTSMTVTGTSAAAAAASSTSSASGGQISAGAILGALGLVVQLVV